MAVVPAGMRSALPEAEHREIPPGKKNASGGMNPEKHGAIVRYKEYNMLCKKVHRSL